MTKIYTSENSNTSILIYADDSRPFNHLTDYDEFVCNAFSVMHDHSQLRQIMSTNFTDKNTWIGYLAEELNVNIGAYTEPMVSKAKRNWELETSLMKGTHGNIFQVNYDDIAWGIFQERWLPVYQSHCCWIKTRLEDKEYDDLQQYLTEISNQITYSVFDLFSGLEVDLDDIQNHPDDKEVIENISRIWLQHLENNLAVTKEHFDTSTLDNFMEFFHEMSISTSLFDCYSKDGDAPFDIISLCRETAFDLYARKNPMVHLGEISNYQECQFGYLDVEGMSTNELEIRVNCAVIGTDEQLDSIKNTLNQFMHGDWYGYEEIKILAQEDFSKYPAAELQKFEDKIYVVKGFGSVGFSSEEEIIEHFEEENNA